MEPENKNNENPSNEEGGVDTELRDFVVKTANAAQSSHATRMMKAFDQKLSKVVSELSDQFASRLEELREARTQGAEVEPDQLLSIKKQYEARIGEIEKKFAAKEAEVAAERQRAARNEERTRLGDALRLAGIGEDRIRGAVALLYTEDQRVGRNEDGEIVFKNRKDGYEEELPLNEGIAQWVNSDEGKYYLPPRAVGGSGNVGGRAPNNKKGETKGELLMELGSALIEARRGAF